MAVRVVRRYGWAHSFLLERQPAGARGEPGGDVARRWQATPADAPFVLHLAEGVDEAARAELARLESLGCLKPNTVIVHGVAIDGDGWRRVARAGAGLVWCPASNAFLFGRSVPVRALLDAADAARPGTARQHRARHRFADHRIARPARRAARRPRRGAGVAAELLRMVTTSGGAAPSTACGTHRGGAPADFVVVPPLAPSAADVLEATDAIAAGHDRRPAARRRSQLRRRSSPRAACRRGRCASTARKARRRGAGAADRGAVRSGTWCGGELAVDNDNGEDGRTESQTEERSNGDERRDSAGSTGRPARPADMRGRIGSRNEHLCGPGGVFIFAIRCTRASLRDARRTSPPFSSVPSLLRL